MDKNDLKSMWRDAHSTNSEINFSKVSIEKTLSLKHSKVISKTLFDVKSKVLLYTLILIIYVGLMIYALVYLKTEFVSQFFSPACIRWYFPFNNCYLRICKIVSPDQNSG